MNKNNVPVKGRPDLVKNEKTGVFHYINNNETIERSREARKTRKQKLEEVDQLKKEVSEMKDMLRQIMEKL